MASPSGEPSFEELSSRRFSFYPAVRNIEHNEWMLKEQTWSELLAENVASRQQVWIPRNYLDTVSSSDSPVLIVGLKRELEYKAGAVFPYHRAVIKMPDSGILRKPAAAKPAAPPHGPTTMEAESRIGRFVGAALGVTLLAGLLAAVVISEGVPNPMDWFRASTETTDQLYLGLSGGDGYHDVVIKLGKPETEQWLSEEDAQIQFQILWYTTRSYAVVMMGASRADARHIGAIHVPSRRLLDSVRLSGGGSTAAMIKNLPEF